VSQRSALPEKQKNGDLTMKAYKTTEIAIQLYQIAPNDAMLNADATETISGLMAGSLLSEHPEILEPLKNAKTLTEAIQALSIIEDHNHRARLITTTLNRFLDDAPIMNRSCWDKENRGFRLSQETLLKDGSYRNIQQVMIAQLRFDRWADGKPVFTVVVRNKLNFSKNINVADHIDFLIERKDLFLPVYDRAKNFNCILRGADKKEVFIYEQRTRKNPNPARIGERFVKAGRMNQEEYDLLVQAQTKFPVCSCTPYSNYKKLYVYPARDIEIIASDSLLKLSNNNQGILFPAELEEAIDLYRFAKSDIRGKMDAKQDILDQLDNLIGQFFNRAPAIRAECNHLQTPRYVLKGRTKIKQAVKLGEAFYTQGVSELGINALCYPRTDSTPEKESKFLSFFSPTSKAGDFGFEYEFVPFSAKMAVQEPVKTAERIVNESGGCHAALVAWPSWTKLPNNKMLEFELMRRGVAVQHVVNQNFKLDAPKISALIKGMAEKFPIKEVPKCDAEGEIAPFHYVFGLDVSRHGDLDIASFPVVIDQNGRVSCTLSETPYTQDKEKRSINEILTVINTILGDAQGSPENPIHLLFLRDGIAFEDYKQVAELLPEHVTLTVISVRKNLLNTCSVDMPEGTFYSLYAQHDDSRFVFGVNARQGDNAKITRLHLAQVMLNPLNLDVKRLGDILIALACQNKTTEVEIASLPFPIAYADRMAWTIRDMLQDPQLCSHVRKTYPDEVDKAGGPSLFIYQEIKRFVSTRANGYSFAI
jgi:hypothetical protein